MKDLTLKNLLFLFRLSFFICHCFGYKYDTQYFKQKVDHFGYANQDTFPQRYFINYDYFNPSNGSIFFYTGNEGYLEMFCNNTGFMWEIAPQFNALLVFAEHRYYGKSLPYGDKSYKDKNLLGYLTSEQALADFAYLITYLKASIPGADRVPLFAFGGSYGGMLAAWIRMKYPHLVDGSVASSAPIWQFNGMTTCESFSEIVTQDFAQADRNCAKSIRRSWGIIRKFGSTESGAKFLTKTFNLCKPLTTSNVSDLLNWLEESWTNLAMTDYPYPTNFLLPLPANPINVACQNLKKSSMSSEELVVNIFKAVSIFQNYTGTVKCFDLKQSDGPLLGADGWDYQACTEMVMPMCHTGTSDMFEPTAWNFTQFSQDCWTNHNVKPDLDKAAIIYGGKNITASSNIIFTNGKLDPWRSGGVLQSLSDSLIAIMIEGAAHHLDLRASNPDDPVSVVNARASVKSILHKWSKDVRFKRFLYSK